MKKYLLIALVIIIFAAGFYLSYLIFKPSVVSQKITSQTILRTLQDKGFLVTQNYTLNQKVTIDKNTGVFWKDFFWGQEITASAVVKINSGVDLRKLAVEDIQLSNKQVKLTLPPIEIQSTEIISDIELQNSQGILKKIFNNEDGYNTALGLIKEQAQTAASQEDLIKEAQASTQKEIQRLISLVASDWQVRVEFKK
jgi:hypothetical protein